MPSSERVFYLLVFTLAALAFWFLGDALLIIFLGLLFAIFLDAGANIINYVIPASRSVRVVIVLTLFFVIIVAFFATGGAVLVDQSGKILEIISDQFRELKTWLASSDGQVPFVAESSGTLDSWLPSMSSLAGRATSAITGLFGVFGNFVVVMMLGMFMALNPEPYRAGILSLLPKDRRDRVGDVLVETGETLRWWVASMCISAAVIALIYWIGLTAIGVPYALALALFAGLMAFIPNLGPLIASIPIVLVALSDSPTTAALAVLLYVFVQGIESYLVTPYVLKKMVSLYPAFTLSVQLIFTALFGLLGLMVASPMAAAGQKLVQRLYVEDVLGGGAKVKSD